MRQTFTTKENIQKFYSLLKYIDCQELVIKIGKTQLPFITIVAKI